YQLCLNSLTQDHEGMLVRPPNPFLVKCLLVAVVAGEIDLEMFSQLRQKHPSITVDNQVIEPSVLVSKTADLDYIKFTWNHMTDLEFKQRVKEEKTIKKADFIHILQVLYYVKDPDATISFFQSLLSQTGKLLITLVSGTTGREILWRKYKRQLATYPGQYISMDDIKGMLDSKGISYRSYQMPSYLDISECFVEGNETAPVEMKEGVLEMLRHPDCSAETDGKIIFNNSIEALVLDPLP
uniref:Histamine N-methyltransferase n=1 Tax=Gadus morhua TaxID=8049 RepID=A0A8C4Z5N3_GADMO